MAAASTQEITQLLRAWGGGDTTIEKELFWSGPGLTATADGRSILYAQNDQTESDIMLVENFSYERRRARRRRLTNIALRGVTSKKGGLR